LRGRSLAEVRRLAQVIEPPPLPQPVCRDPDDDEVLALAIIAAKAELFSHGRKLPSFAEVAFQ
jgi:predicted nucleic acid-binding protein